MLKLSRAYQRTAEFLGRQGELFAEILQTAISNTRAELAASLTRWKRNWSKWFPVTALPYHQLVLELDALAQIPLFRHA